MSTRDCFHRRGCGHRDSVTFWWNVKYLFCTSVFYTMVNSAGGLHIIDGGCGQVKMNMNKVWAAIVPLAGLWKCLHCAFLSFYALCFTWWWKIVDWCDLWLVRRGRSLLCGTEHRVIGYQESRFSSPLRFPCCSLLHLQPLERCPSCPQL